MVKQLWSLFKKTKKKPNEPKVIDNAVDSVNAANKKTNEARVNDYTSGAKLHKKYNKKKD